MKHRVCCTTCCGYELCSSGLGPPPPERSFFPVFSRSVCHPSSLVPLVCVSCSFLILLSWKLWCPRDNCISGLRDIHQEGAFILRDSELYSPFFRLPSLYGLLKGASLYFPAMPGKEPDQWIVHNSKSHAVIECSCVTAERGYVGVLFSNCNRHATFDVQKEKGCSLGRGLSICRGKCYQAGQCISFVFFFSF